MGVRCIKQRPTKEWLRVAMYVYCEQRILPIIHRRGVGNLRLHFLSHFFFNLENISAHVVANILKRRKGDKRGAERKSFRDAASLHWHLLEVDCDKGNNTWRMVLVNSVYYNKHDMNKTARGCVNTAHMWEAAEGWIGLCCRFGKLWTWVKPSISFNGR